MNIKKKNLKFKRKNSSTKSCFIYTIYKYINLKNNI